MIEQIALAGHDSELFSFLDREYVEQLAGHPAADFPLWSFGREDGGRLTSVPMWNSSPGCFAWTAMPRVTKEEDSNFSNYRGFVTDDPLLEVAALALVRLLFVQGYTCALDDAPWIERPADRTLERLPYLRNYAGRSTDSPEWPRLRAGYFDWALRALEHVETFSSDS